MPTLSDSSLRDCATWEAAPRWVHFGAGNIFKAFQVNAAQAPLDEGSMRSGIVAVKRSDSLEKRVSYDI